MCDGLGSITSLMRFRVNADFETREAESLPSVEREGATDLTEMDIREAGDYKSHARALSRSI